MTAPPVLRRPDEAVCSACGKPIRWTVTAANRKAQPVDYDPNPQGNVRLRDEYQQTPYGVSPVSEVVSKDEQLSFDGPGERYMPHHATCEFADQFRKPKVVAGQ